MEEISPEIKKERERIKAIIENKKISIEIICQTNAEKSHRKRNLHSIAKSRAKRILDNIVFSIDNPDKISYPD